ncbi:MAG: SDR family oxidoreductase [Omnitrophica WOR_2 bacterium]
MPSVFMTGFPGFIGCQLVLRRLERCPEDVRINCLVQSAYRPQAEAQAKKIVTEIGCPQARLHLVDGDITRTDLGLGKSYAGLAEDTTEIYHLAAVYDAGVKREFAERVNVGGTRNMLDFAAACTNLARFHYVSTCYVSGHHVGRFSEDDLECDQSFNNYYEETKFKAEVEVQRCMTDGLPASIYRPSIVAGDSRSGATQKFDGIYYMLRFLLRQPRFLALIPRVGNPKQYEINVVPRDFVVDAINYLSTQPGSLGKVYQLCDPNPHKVDDMWKILSKAVQRRIMPVPLSRDQVKWFLRDAWPINAYMKIEPECVNYVTTHPTHYTCENTLADLAGTGIVCPPIESYIGTLLAFMQAHPEISPNAMV